MVVLDFLVMTIVIMDEMDPLFIKIKELTLEGWKDHTNTTKRALQHASFVHMSANERLSRKLKWVLETIFDDDDAQGKKLKADLDSATNSACDMMGKCRELESFAKDFMTQYMNYEEPTFKRKQPLELAIMVDFKTDA